MKKSRKAQMGEIEVDFYSVAARRRRVFEKLLRAVEIMETENPWLIEGNPDKNTGANAGMDEAMILATYKEHLERLETLQRDIQTQLPVAAAANKNIIEAEMKEGFLVPAIEFTSLFAQLAQVARQYIPPELLYKFEGDTRVLQQNFLMRNQGVLKALSKGKEDDDDA